MTCQHIHVHVLVRLLPFVCCQWVWDTTTLRATGEPRSDPWVIRLTLLDTAVFPTTLSLTDALHILDTHVGVYATGATLDHDIQEHAITTRIQWQTSRMRGYDDAGLLMMALTHHVELLQEKEGTELEVCIAHQQRPYVACHTHASHDAHITLCYVVQYITILGPLRSILSTTWTLIETHVTDITWYAATPMHDMYREKVEEQLMHDVQVEDWNVEDPYGFGKG